MKSNPVSYKLKKAYSLRDLRLRVKQVHQIYANFRKQARAAYVYRRNKIVDEANFKFFHDEKACNEAMHAAWNLWDKSSARLEDHFTKAEAATVDVIQREPSISDTTKVILFNERLDRINFSDIKLSRMTLEAYQKDAYSKQRIKSQTKKRDGANFSAVSSFKVKGDIFKELKQRYPHISAKNKPRLTRLYSAWWQVAGRFPKAEEIRPTQLVEAGIPAAEVVGPWWPRTKSIKSPMDWVRETSGFTSPGNNRSPLIQQWLNHIDMDEHDRALVDSVSHYWHQHKAVPSVEWVRRRNNELEEARKEKEIESDLPGVKSWLQASNNWREDDKVIIPPMPDPTFRVIGPRDAKLLCERAKRDGLCVVDVLNELYEREEDMSEEEFEFIEDPLFERSAKEGVCTLIISDDPKRRTVVGLNQNGICTSEHHCTGKSNEVDMVAWEYFRKR